MRGFNHILIFVSILTCLLLCQCQNGTQNGINERADYVRRAREQDSLRIARYQDSLKQAEQLAVIQREKDEVERLKAAQKKSLRIQIDTIYAKVYKPNISHYLYLQYLKMYKRELRPIVEDLVSRVKSDTLWMDMDTQNKYRHIKHTHNRYLKMEEFEKQLSDSATSTAPSFGLR